MLYNATEKVFTFHDASDTASDGEILVVSSGVNLVNIEVKGTSTDFVIKTYGKILENWYEMTGINLRNFNLCSTCLEVGQLIQVDLTGLIEFKVKIESINDGNLTVVGRVVT